MKDQQIKEDKSPFIENIDEIYQKINFYKKSLISGLVCVVFQTVTILCLIFSSPIVIVEKDGERLGYVGEKKELVVTVAYSSLFIKRVFKEEKPSKFMCPYSFTMKIYKKQ